MRVTPSSKSKPVGASVASNLQLDRDSTVTPLQVRELLSDRLSRVGA
ncbi:hypothetical protein JOE48_000089 [Methylobacterium sp. PvR107]|nr:hypothetical protein [Methylobacterium sp. PvR107]